jgi:hypothetical protein
VTQRFEYPAGSRITNALAFKTVDHPDGYVYQNGTGFVVGLPQAGNAAGKAKIRLTACIDGHKEPTRPAAVNTNGIIGGHWVFGLSFLSSPQRDRHPA